MSLLLANVIENFSGFGGLSCQLNCFTPGLLATVSELKTHLVLPADLGAKFNGQQGQWHFGYEKTTILKFGSNSSLALTLTMRNGSWEAPKGDSGSSSSEPIVESIELSGPGNLGLPPPASARRIAGQRPANAALMISWPGGNYLSEDLTEPSFYLGNFIGRAPFHFTETERRTVERTLIDISKAMSKGGLDVPAHMAKFYAKRRVTDTEQFGFSASKTNHSRAVATNPAPKRLIDEKRYGYESKTCFAISVRLGHGGRRHSMKHYSTSLGLLLSISVSLMGCFNPERSDKLNCSSEGQCPIGISCGSDNVCLTDGTIDANQAIGDGNDFVDATPLPDSRQSAADAMILIDATPVDCLDDNDCLTSGNLCLLAGTCNTNTGVCSFPDVVQCSSGTDCSNNTCNPSTGNCEAQNVNEGVECGAGDLCTGYGPCTTNTCNTNGTQSRTCQNNRCSSGTCVEQPSSQPLTQSCTRNTNGDSCSSSGSTCTDCSGYADSCDQSGSQVCTGLNRCLGGTCSASSGVGSSVACTRNTDNNLCGGGTDCTECSGFSATNVCDELGEQDCTTLNRCAGGTCSASSAGAVSESCSRDTDNDECDNGGTSCSACTGFTYNCDQSGTQDCTALNRCAGGTCSALSGGSSPQVCTRNINGESCFENCDLAPGEPGFRSGTCSNGACGDLGVCM